MKLREQNVLFFSRTMGQGGAERVVLQLCKVLRPFVNKIVVCSSGGVFVKELNDMNITHYEIIDIERKSPCIFLKNWVRLRRIIKKENITVIHAHHRMAALYTRILCWRKKSL